LHLVKVHGNGAAQVLGCHKLVEIEVSAVLGARVGFDVDIRDVDLVRVLVQRVDIAMETAVGRGA